MTLYRVRKPRIIDNYDVNGFFTLENAVLTIRDKDTGTFYYSGTTSGNYVELDIRHYSLDLLLTVTKNHYITTRRTVHLGNPDNNDIYGFVKVDTGHEIACIELDREKNYCVANKYLNEYVHSFFTRKFQLFELSESGRVAVSKPSFMTECTTQLNTVLDHQLPTPYNLDDFKGGFVQELNDGDALYTKYVEGPQGEDETDLDYTWDTKHAYVFENSFLLNANEKEYDYLTFEAYDENVNDFSVRLERNGTPNTVYLQYRLVDKDFGRQVSNPSNPISGTSYVITTSNEFSSVVTDLRSGTSANISSSRVNITVNDRLSYNGTTYELVANDSGGYTLVEDTGYGEWVDYTIGSTVTSTDPGVIIQFRRNNNIIAPPVSSGGGSGSGSSSGEIGGSTDKGEDSGSGDKSGDNDLRYWFSGDIDDYYRFVVSGGEVKVYGSVNTIIDANDEIVDFTTTACSLTCAFIKLFSNNSLIKDVSDLYLKGQYLSPYCYESMFSNLTNISAPPVIEATTLSTGCCANMFSEDTSLLSVPTVIYRIPNLVERCYYEMFNNCSSLKTSQTGWFRVISAEDYSCYSMFNNCVSNDTISVLFTLPKDTPPHCFENMFLNNIAARTGYIRITTTYVKESAFKKCFSNCYYLEPSSLYILLDGQIDNSGCYEMFSACYHLTNNSDSISTGAKSFGTSACTSMFNFCLELKNPMKFVSDITDSFYTLGYYCFASMYYNCGKMQTVPGPIHALYFPPFCCDSMFKLCSSITDATNIFQTQVINYELDYKCFYEMFAFCDKLEKAPCLSYASLEISCCSAMFYECINLNSKNSFMFTQTIFPENCFEYMFFHSGDVLVDFLASNATARTESFQHMFESSNIKIPPTKIPSNLGIRSCYYMFSNCKLEADTALKATSLPKECYAYMFFKAKINDFLTTFETRTFTSAGERCFSHMFDSASATSEYNGLCSGYIVIKRINAANEYFVRVWESEDEFDNQVIERNIRANSTTEWIIPYRDAYISRNHGYLCLNNSRLKYMFTRSGSLDSDFYDLRYSGSTEKITIDDVISLEENQSIYAKDDLIISGQPGIYRIKNVGKDDVQLRFGGTLGNYACEYMFNNCDFVYDASKITFYEETNIGTGCFSHMFSNCKNLYSIPDLFTIMRVSNKCYEYMFENCTNLAALFSTRHKLQTIITDAENRVMKYLSIPDVSYFPGDIFISPYYIFKNTNNIPSIPQDACVGMFKGCTKLVYAPIIQKIPMGSGCYKYMFSGCTNLNTIGYLSDTAPSSAYTLDWVKGVSSSGYFLKGNYATWTNVYSTNSIPSNWNVINNYEPGN